MKRTIILLIGLMCSTALYAGGAQELSPQTDAEGFKMVSTGDIEVRWKVEDPNIRFEVSAPTTGWVSVGFNPTRVMKDADIIIGYVEGSQAVVVDQFGNGSFSHKADVDMGGSDDIVEYGGNESDGRTELFFTIPIDSGDAYDSVLTPGEEHTILFAFGPDGADNFSSKHTERAKVQLEL